MAAILLTAGSPFDQFRTLRLSKGASLCIQLPASLSSVTQHRSSSIGHLTKIHEKPQPTHPRHSAQ